jgi:hypothetical protein
LSKCHVSKLIWLILREKIIRIKAFGILVVFLIIFNRIEEDLDNPSFWYGDVGVRNRIIFGAGSFMTRKQVVEPEIRK